MKILLFVSSGFILGLNAGVPQMEIIWNTEVKQVTVGGQIRELGPFEYVEGMTLKTAVKKAGGVTEFGSLKRVTLYRKGVATCYDLTVTKFEDIKLLPADIIEVGMKTLCAEE